MSSPHDLPADPNLLLALDMLLTECNVTRAAERMRVTQSAMSHKLRLLRDIFGDPLLVRGKGGLHLTEKAQAIHPGLNAALKDLSQAVRQGLGFDPQKDSRNFTIAMGDYAECLLLPRLAQTLPSTAPNVNISQALLPPSEQLSVFLEKGKADLAIVGPTLQGDDLRRKTLPPERFVVLVHRDHPRIDDALSLERYLEESHVLVTPGGEPTGIVDRVLQSQEKHRNVVMRTRHFLVAPLLVSRSDLILTLPHRLAVEVLSYLPLKWFPPPLELPTVTAYIVWHERSHLDPGHRWLREFLLQQTESTDEEFEESLQARAVGA